jgi:hypothetical protein
MDQNPGKSLVLPAQDARALRDEIAKLMADKLEQAGQSARQDVIQVEISGGKF